MSSFLSELTSEKPSSFSQTCSLLSRYLKENKGTLGDLSLGMSFHNNGMPVAGATQTTETSDISTMDLFPQHSGFEPSVLEDEFTKISNNDHSVNKPTPISSQMTIFYRGQTFVYNDISEDKALEITTFASQPSFQVPNFFVSAPIERPRETNSTIGNMHVEKLSSPIATDLPLTRKASLTRFFEKRKERISTRAPYQKNNSKALLSKDYKKTWLGLSPQSPPEHFEFRS